MSGSLLTAAPGSPETRRRYRIFIVHPSNLLTDHIGNGDGLAANGFVRQLAARGHEIHVACDRFDLREPLPSNVTLYPLRTERWPRPLDRLVYLVRARQVYDRLRLHRPFDLVTQLNPVSVGLSLGMRGCGVPIVLGPYVPPWPDDEHTGFARRRARALEHRLRSAITASTQADAAALLVSSPAALPCVERRVPKERIFFVPFGVPGSFLDLAPQPFPPGRPREILFIGGLQQRKGLPTLLEAFSLVAHEQPDVRLRIIGYGRMLSEVEAAARVAAPGSIIIDGHIPSAMIPEKIMGADVFCATSIGEPFGIALIEAMACSRAVVATRSGAFPYLLPEGGGMLVPPRDRDALASALLQVLASSNLREQMGRVNRNHVREYFTWDRVIDKLEQVYAEVVDTSNVLHAR